MSLQSMTGYGRGHAQGDGVAVQVEVHAVNRKQLDVVCNLPRPLAHLEAAIMPCVRPAVARGRVTVDVKVDWTQRARCQAVRVDTDLAAAYVKRLRAAARQLDVSQELDIMFIAGLPDVVQHVPPHEDSARIQPVLEKAVRMALRALLAMRRREGRALQQDLRERLDALGQRLEAIQSAAPAVARRYRKRLQQRIDAAGLALDGADERLLKEVALFADRSDIQEEITRLQSHLQQARRLMRSREAAGRALDFLAQECFREINTIGSKANDAAILQQVVAFKTELERIREQVQNIE